jgi:3-methyladenine DNA glycosylase/8-oxoguanine DNA glycosylase
VIAAVGPCRIELRTHLDVFGALARAIVYQQLSGRAAETIYGRVCALCPPRSKLTPDAVVRLSDAKLRGAGLSRMKLRALRDLSRKTLSGVVPTLRAIHRMDDAAIVERLVQVRGIGRWSAEMLLMFRLGRPDVLPLDDYGVRKGFTLMMRKRALASRAQLEARGERWRPYRTVASWYLWRVLELPKEGARG